MLQNGAKFTQKLTTDFKNQMKSLDNSDKECKVKKNEIRCATFGQKYIPLAKTLYTEH